MMEAAMECCVPPGFRFHPTDEELVGYYLRKKVASQKIDLDVIRDIDLYRIEPWDLQDRCRIGYEEQNEWYFFSHKDKKYPTGTRTNRATMAGFWKATGRDKAVYDKSKLIGMRKTLVFYKGRAPNGQKTDWIMHEYRLESDENGPPQEEGWVVCRAFKKRATSTSTQSSNSKCMEAWDSSYLYEEASGVSSVADPSLLGQTLLCKQEIEGDTLNLIMQQQPDPFVQLPQLESPSLPPLKRPRTSISLISQTNFHEDHDHLHWCNIDKTNKKGAVTADWRDLDKFVASQLSQEDRLVESNGVGSLIGSMEHHGSSSDMSMLLLQSGGKEEEEEGGCRLMMSGLLNSTTSDSDDIGIFIFDK